MRHETLLLQLKSEQKNLTESLAFWEAQPPIEVRQAPGFMHEIRSSQIAAIKAALHQNSEAIRILEADIA